MTVSEQVINNINSNIFFREFSFSKNEFINLNNNQKVEFADNVVWLDELLFLYQIKEQDKTSSNPESWFVNKVEKKAVKQIKSTLDYFYNQPTIVIENEKGHKIDITAARSCTDIKKIIIYKTQENFPYYLKTKKFYDSTEIGFIHLFDCEDYNMICEYLVTPTEINEYFNFREKTFKSSKEIANALDEKILLASFLTDTERGFIDINTQYDLKDFHKDKNDFDISYLMKHFEDKLLHKENETVYYPVIKEFAKLNRAELKIFKNHLNFCFKRPSEEKDFLLKNWYSLRTDCSFIFITGPYIDDQIIYLHEELKALTNSYKQQDKAQKAIGIIVLKNGKWIDMNFCLL